METAAEWALQHEAASLSQAEAEKRQKAARAIYGEPFEKQVIFDAESNLLAGPERGPVLCLNRGVDADSAE